MPWLTDEQAAAEVSKWNIDCEKDLGKLKPALVTRKDLWDLYTTRNTDWAASVAEMGLSAATSVLTGSGTFSAISWMTDIITDSLQGALVDGAIEKGVDHIQYIAGAHLTQRDRVKGFQFEAGKKFTIKLASGFLTILVAAAGGVLTAATAGGTAAATILALVVYVGESNEAKKMKHWGEVVESAMEKYDKIREEKLKQIQTKSRNELERFVLSNAYQDLEDSKLVKTYRWKVNNQTITARYPRSLLNLLLRHMIAIDETLGKGLWNTDLFEISREYPEETRGTWHNYEMEKGRASKVAQAGEVKTFDKEQIRAFMRRQIESHVEVAKVPTTKTEGVMEEKWKQVMSKYGQVSEVVDGEEDYEYDVCEDENMDEGGSTLPLPMHQEFGTKQQKPLVGK